MPITDKYSVRATNRQAPLPAIDVVRRSDRRYAGRRSGIAIILVLGMIAMTMAVAYSMMRSQVAQLKNSSGGELRTDARNAALSGFSAALRKMNQSSWAGADSTFSGTLSSTQSFTATYTTGDDSLTVTDPEAADWPYRITITSTGYATDPSVSTVPTLYRIQAVADFVPKKTATNPTIWAGMQSYVVIKPAPTISRCRSLSASPGPCGFKGA